MFGDTSPLQGWTPLHLAALYGDHAEVAQLLLQHLADVNAQTDQCRNALRARPPPHGLRPLLPPLDRRGLTPLHYAAFKGHSKVAQLLVDANASPDSRYNSGPGVVSRTMCLGLRAWQQWFFVWFRRFNSFLFFNWGSKGFWKAGSGLKTWWVENIQRANRMPCKETYSRRQDAWAFAIRHWQWQAKRAKRTSWRSYARLQRSPAGKRLRLWFSCAWRFLKIFCISAWSALVLSKISDTIAALDSNGNSGKNATA